MSEQGKRGKHLEDNDVAVKKDGAEYAKVDEIADEMAR